MSFTRALAIITITAFVFTRSNAVFAQAKSVTLLGVSGVDGARFARALERELGELYDLVSATTYRRSAERLGRLGAAPEDVRAVASAIKVDAVVAGAVVGGGHNRRLLIAVREGVTGRVVARAHYDLSGRTLPLLRERVVSDLVRALDRVRPIGSAASPAEPEPAASSEAVATASEDVSPATAVTSVAAPTRAVAGVFAGVGPTLLSRSLSFNVPSAPSYSGGAIAGIRAEGAVFPLALSAELAEQHPVLASFGFAGYYEYAFNFTSSTATGKTVSHASRWNVGLVSRIPLGHRAVAGTLILDTGVAQMSFGSAAPVDIGVPDVRYDMISAGLGWERALGTRWAVLSLRIGYDGLFSAGDIQSDGQYGSGNGWGMGGGAGVTAWPTSWLWLRLAGKYDRIALSFAGSGTRYARSAADQWMGGALEVGFAL
jgi:hypothetical protein